MMKVACLLTLALLVCTADAAVPSAERMKGPFLIASTPYLADGSVDYDALVAEAKYMDASGCTGVIWPQSNDSIDLLAHEEKFTALRRNRAPSAKGMAGSWRTSSSRPRRKPSWTRTSPR